MGFTLTKWTPKFLRTPFHSVSIAFERQKNTSCTFAIQEIQIHVVLCSWCDAKVRARKIFGRFSIVLYRLHFNVESDQSGVVGFFFSLLVCNEKTSNLLKI